ncbi:MAG: A24 family peptidase [Treponema sp.]|nr:A24 family peptidase [Treponema sp.]
MQSLILLLFIGISVVLCISDIREYKIPLPVLYIGFVLTVICTVFINQKNLKNSIVGMVVLFAIYILVFLILPNGLGLGDVQYSLYCGFVCGFPNILFSAIIASFLGILYYLIFFLRNNKSKIKIPFIPFMFIGTILAKFINMEIFYA